LRLNHQCGQFRGTVHHAHTAPAAARRGFDDQWEADLCRLTSRNHRYPRLARDPLRLELVAACAQRIRRRPDPGQPGCVDGLGEVGVLGEEAVARVNRVRSGLLRRANVLLGEEVARDLHRLVGGTRVERAIVVGSDDRDGGDSEVSRRAKNS
jgi:hypothetical protein